jgi:ankyrin repeat protein
MIEVHDDLNLLTLISLSNLINKRMLFADLTKLLEWNKAHFCPQNKDLTTQRDENGSTPLHFAAERISSICRQVLEANLDALYQPDHAGFFPIHVAASVGASSNIAMFVKKCPGCASLRDAKGRTFLHVATEKKKLNIIRSACRNLSLSWIMNMVDNDGNTALHLAVEAGSLRMFCPLLGNPQMNLNLPNNRGDTPSDIAEYKFPKDGLNYTWVRNPYAHFILRNN